ncbi:GGDEF domain-containing protein [Vibrio rumoiensis]|uniref:diguanylate cyclase n=1 Tax=Vibrio rumoiensis 1S-45 TaxID=1188252 RepID=A0A1E5E3F7_9VIBR|nr:GGDEF domain-containing protein [Vibrio rumoiensis]OEF25916.1 hypothetical protein A1QC_07795 [Vibrio rumoiensis 1S-45]
MLKFKLNRNKSIVIIIVINIILFGLYTAFGHNKELVISPDYYSYSANSDQVIGGKSTAKLKLLDESALMDCELKKSDYLWPYCEMTIKLSDDISKGLDLSGYRSVYLDIDYKGPKTGTHRVRVNIRNYEPNVFDPKDDNTLKYNGVEYQTGYGEGGRDVSYNKFQVLTWWIFDYHVGLDDSGVNFDNVPMIQIATDSGSTLGKHEIRVNHIVFKGDYIKPVWFAAILLSIWICSAIVYLVLQVIAYRKRVNKMEKHTQHLDELNVTLANKYSQAAQMALKDELTGISNRHAIREWLDATARKVRWELSSLSIIYMDIDHFKTVNDHFGHQIGDQVLCEFAKVVSSQLRDGDHFVRWGGEEFVIFCPEVTLDVATSIAERVRATVAAHQWQEVGKITCSLGVAEMKPTERIAEFIARADEALYTAKNNGRNRVEVSMRLD